MVNVRGQDVHPRRCQKNGFSVIAEGCKDVAGVGGGDADDSPVACGICRLRDCIITHCCHKDDIPGPGIVDGILKVLAEAGIAEAHEDHVGSMIDRVENTRYDIAVLAGAVCAKNGDGHCLYAGKADAHYACIIGNGCHDSCQLCTVAVGSVVPAEPAMIDVPATILPLRSGCDASTPVSRIATVTCPRGGGKPISQGKSTLFAASGNRRLGRVPKRMSARVLSMFFRAAADDMG
jgi:hypothetical protein